MACMAWYGMICKKNRAQVSTSSCVCICMCISLSYPYPFRILTIRTKQLGGWASVLVKDGMRFFLYVCLINTQPLWVCQPPSDRVSSKFVATIIMDPVFHCWLNYSPSYPFLWMIEFPCWSFPTWGNEPSNKFVVVLVQTICLSATNLPNLTLDSIRSIACLVSICP